jgi:hypothetical protein
MGTGLFPIFPNEEFHVSSLTSDDVVVVGIDACIVLGDDDDDVFIAAFHDTEIDG